MTQFTSHIDFSLTKKRLKMMGRRMSKIKVGALWLFVLPVSVALIIVLSAQPHNYPESYSLEDYWNSQPPTTYYDVELTYDGKPEYHHLDERNGLFRDEDGNPYDGTRTKFEIESDRKIITETFSDGKMMQQQFFSYDSTGALKYNSLAKASVSDQGEFITEHFSFVDTDSTYRNMVITEVDSTRNYKLFWPNGQLMSEWNVVVDYETPDLIKFGRQTYYDQSGMLEKHEVYENGELIEEIK